MFTFERLFESEDNDPIDILEALAAHYKWDFDRITEDEIAVSIEGSWRTYGVTLSSDPRDEILKVICSFELNPPMSRLSNLKEGLNLANSKCWTGAFVFSQKQSLMVFRYGLNLIGGARATATQIDSIIEDAVLACDTFYPAFQLICCGEEDPKQAMSVAFDKSYGRA